MLINTMLVAFMLSIMTVKYTKARQPIEVRVDGERVLSKDS